MIPSDPGLSSVLVHFRLIHLPDARRKRLLLPTQNRNDLGIGTRQFLVLPSFHGTGCKRRMVEFRLSPAIEIIELVHPTSNGPGGSIGEPCGKETASPHPR